MHIFDFPGGLDGKASVYNAGDLGSIPGSGRFLGEGNGNPLQYSRLGNPEDRETRWVTIHGAMKEPGRTQQLNSNKHSVVLSFSNATVKIRKADIRLLSMWALDPGPDSIQLYELGPQFPGLQTRADVSTYFQVCWEDGVR